MQENQIKIVCQICNVNSDNQNAWRLKCGLHGGPVCMSCCMECEYMNKFSGLFHCQYKTPAMKRMEAAKKKEQEFIEENRRASKLIREQMREEAKKRAIKRAKANKRKRK